VTDALDRLRAALADRYAIERELGQGGMATVYFARDLKLGRAVALKVLRPELAASLGGERFLREIEIAAKLAHPHILALFDCGEAAGLLYYTMPFVEGETLRDRLIREKQLPLEDALRITREVADALGYAHSRGLVHRDIKPENILFAAGHAVVSDFGIARAVSAAGTARLTETGLAIGTPAYMSPEQAAGSQEVDGRSDLYSLGCVLYEMLGGDPPFYASTPQAVLAKKLSEAVPRISVVRDAVPAGVEAALTKALARTPADRWPTAADFAAALMETEAQGHRGTGAQGAPRARWLVAAGIAALVIAAGVWAAARHWAPAQVSNANAIPLDGTAIAVLPFHVLGADSGSPARNLASDMGDRFEITVTGEFGRRILHPGSVAQRWRAAGGTLDSALSEEAELAVARALGAGRLVRGTVVVAGDSLVVSASMVSVATGRVRVAPVQVRGTSARPEALVDRLISQLLARDAGISPEEAPRLAQHKPEAIQAYLAGNRAGDEREAKAYYRAALAADSNLVDAAVALYSRGEYAEDSTELRYAWEHQDRLTERNRALLQVLAAGRHGRIRTMADKIAGYEALTRRWPEWRRPWSDVGDCLTNFGALAGVPDYRRRAREALERVDAGVGAVLRELLELAFMDDDTARARAAIDSGAARVSRAIAGGATAFRWRTGAAYRWRLAVLEGDTAAAARALPQSQEGIMVLPFALADGRGVAQADRAAAGELAENNYVKRVWAWARGREQAWREAWRRYGPQIPGELGQSTVPVHYALLLGASEDARVTDAVRQLERLARGQASPPVSPDDQALARSWLALWRLRHGDTTGARATRRYLESDEDRRYRFVGWARLIDVLLTEAEGGDVRAALLRMDSVVRELPLPTGWAQWEPYPAEVQNLMLARMLRRYGEPELALAAARRRQYMFATDWDALPEFLREEGSLAAQLGDTAGAVRAYRHYLALRENPDPLWRAPWDSVRAELAALVRR
jgi:serine/threonine-protein kinase